MSTVFQEHHAQWICAPRQGCATPVFRREFWVDRPLASAQISLCGLGQFALFLGNTPLNHGVLEPGWTRYTKRCLYSTYDLTAYLDQGENILSVLIGNGMYHVSGERYVKFTGSFGPPTLIAVIELSYADGSREVLVTDKDWYYAPSPITHSCIYGGEDYDARISAWRAPMAAQPDAWQPAEPWEGPGGVLEEGRQPQVAIQSQLDPVEQIQLAPGRIRVDFGRNFAGRVAIRVRGAAGQTVRVTPGELLDSHGEINQEFSGSPHFYTYTLAGDGEEAYLPYFTYYGLRYAVIETEAELLSATGVESYADCLEGGSFRCSNELYNQIHQMILGAIRSNMQSVFTDCPHREKLGWLEQLHLIGPGVLYNYDAKALMAKVLQDMEDSQTEEGLVPDICPEYVEFELGFRDSPEWGSSCVILPWYLYERYGDLELLAAHYDMSRRYVDYLLSRAENYILNYGLGDWLDVGHYPAHPAHTPIPLTASAMLCYDLKIMERTARALGRYEDLQLYREHALKAREAFNHAFYYPLSGNYGTGSQASNALPLYLELPSETEQPRVLANLVEDIQRRDYHLTGGDIGHPFILRALSVCGREDIVAKVMGRTDFPSYGNMIRCGATTLCEDWDGANPEHPWSSQNHFMLGGAEEWFYHYLAGAYIDMAQEYPLTLSPAFPEEVDWVEGQVRIDGEAIPFRWDKLDDRVQITVTLPKGMGAKIIMPFDARMIAPSPDGPQTITVKGIL